MACVVNAWFVHSKTNTLFVALIVYCILIEVAYCGTDGGVMKKTRSRKTVAPENEEPENAPLIDLDKFATGFMSKVGENILTNSVPGGRLALPIITKAYAQYNAATAQESKAPESQEPETKSRKRVSIAPIENEAPESQEPGADVRVIKKTRSRKSKAPENEEPENEAPESPEPESSEPENTPPINMESFTSFLTSSASLISNKLPGGPSIAGKIGETMLSNTLPGGNVIVPYLSNFLAKPENKAEEPPINMNRRKKKTRKVEEVFNTIVDNVADTTVQKYTPTITRTVTEKGILSNIVPGGTNAETDAMVTKVLSRKAGEAVHSYAPVLAQKVLDSQNPAVAALSEVVGGAAENLSTDTMSLDRETLMEAASGAANALGGMIKEAFVSDPTAVFSSAAAGFFTGGPPGCLGGAAFALGKAAMANSAKKSALRKAQKEAGDESDEESDDESDDESDHESKAPVKPLSKAPVKPLSKAPVEHQISDTDSEEETPTKAPARAPARAPAPTKAPARAPAPTKAPIVTHPESDSEEESDEENEEETKVPARTPSKAPVVTHPESDSEEESEEDYGASTKLEMSDTDSDSDDVVDQLCMAQIETDFNNQHALGIAKIMFEEKEWNKLLPASQRYVKYLYRLMLKDDFACDILEELFFWTKMNELSDFDQDKVKYNTEKMVETKCIISNKKTSNSESNKELLRFNNMTNNDLQQYTSYAMVNTNVLTNCEFLGLIFHRTKSSFSSEYDMEDVLIQYKGIMNSYLNTLVDRKAQPPSKYCSVSCKTQVSIAFNYCVKPEDCFFDAFRYMVTKDVPKIAEDYLNHLLDYAKIYSSVGSFQTMTSDIFCNDVTVLLMILAHAEAKIIEPITERDIQLKKLKCKRHMIQERLSGYHTNIPENTDTTTRQYINYVLNHISLNYIPTESAAYTFVGYLLENWVAFEGISVLTIEQFCARQAEKKMD